MGVIVSVAFAEHGNLFAIFREIGLYLAMGLIIKFGFVPLLITIKMDFQGSLFEITHFYIVQISGLNSKRIKSSTPGPNEFH